MQEIDGEIYLSVEEAADILEVKPATLYAYVSRGLLRSYRRGVGRARLYRRDEVTAMRELRGAEEAPPPAASPDEDGVLRNVQLPNVETWAGDH